MKKLLGKDTEKSRDNDNNQKLQQNCSYCGKFLHKTQGTATIVVVINFKHYEGLYVITEVDKCKWQKRLKRFNFPLTMKVKLI